METVNIENSACCTIKIKCSNLKFWANLKNHEQNIMSEAHINIKNSSNSTGVPFVEKGLFCLLNGISYAGKMLFLYWNRLMIPYLHPITIYTDLANFYIEPMPVVIMYGMAQWPSSLYVTPFTTPGYCCHDVWIPLVQTWTVMILSKIGPY